MLYVLLKNPKTQETKWETVRDDGHTSTYDDIFNITAKIMETYASDWEITDVLNANDSLMLRASDDEQSFMKNAHRFGLDPRLYGKTLHGKDGSKYVINGIRTKNWRYPILLEKTLPDGTVRRVKTSQFGLKSLLTLDVNAGVLGA